MRAIISRQRQGSRGLFAVLVALAMLVLGLGPFGLDFVGVTPAHAASDHGEDGREKQGDEVDDRGEDNDDDGDDDRDDDEDEDDNRHPSGKDRSVEDGKSGTQGAASSDPDDDGRGPDRSNGGRDKPGGSGGIDGADQDGNNGCGNDDDFEDDNEGWCGHKPDGDDGQDDAEVRASAEEHEQSGDRRGDRKSEETRSASASTADMTIEATCNAVSVTSSKDISHVEVTFDDGTSTKFDGLKGHEWSREFSQPIVAARAKSAQTVVSDRSGDCDAAVLAERSDDGTCEKPDSDEAKDECKVDGDDNGDDSDEGDDGTDVEGTGDSTAKMDGESKPGCAEDVTVEVRDVATQEPVAGAVVLVGDTKVVLDDSGEANVGHICDESVLAVLLVIPDGYEAVDGVDAAMTDEGDIDLVLSVAAGGATTSEDVTPDEDVSVLGVVADRGAGGGEGSTSGPAADAAVLGAGAADATTGAPDDSVTGPLAFTGMDAAQLLATAAAALLLGAGTLVAARRRRGTS